MSKVDDVDKASCFTDYQQASPAGLHGLKATYTDRNNNLAAINNRAEVEIKVRNSKSKILNFEP